MKKVLSKSRPPIAVWSNDANVDPVGACVGARGARVRMVTNELRGEKVDIVSFSDDPREFVMRALQPAKVKDVHLDDLTGTATVVVHDFQLSLAIGKEGQNARLAARLTGWRIDIKSETQMAEEAAYADQEWAEGEWVTNEAGEMVWQPAEGGEALSAEEWNLAESAVLVPTDDASDREATSAGADSAGADSATAARAAPALSGEDPVGTDPGPRGPEPTELEVPGPVESDEPAPPAVAGADGEA